MKKASFFFLVLSLFFLASNAITQPDIKREIIVLYDSTDGVSQDKNDIHEMLEVVLNYLGLTVTYKDASQSLPSNEQKFRAIICNFIDRRLPNVEDFWKWLETQLGRKTKVIFWGDLPIEEEGYPCDLGIINNALKLMGISYQPNNTNDPEQIEIIHKDQKIFDYEKKLERISSIQGIRSIFPENSVFLRVNDKRTGQMFDLATIGPLGGLALSGCLYYQRFDRVRLWYIDPFSFIKEALEIKNRFPIPDVTTLNGRRILFSHIDGDGFTSLSYIKQNMTCGEIIRDEILKQYALPTTISVIAGIFLPEYQKDKELRKRIITTAQEIFSLPQVDIASHSYSHPFSWLKLEGGGPYSLSIPGYTFSPRKEVELSVDFINQFLANSKKKVKILLWSGDCLPQEEAILTCERMDLANMNGGESRKDRAFPSYSGLSPLYRQVGNSIQFYAQAQNENTYTNLWTGPFWGFKNVVETFENTESPFRIKPINIYCHFYSGEHISSLNALKSVFDWAQKQSVAMIWAREYVQIVKDFMAIKIENIPDEGYLIQNNGWCRTIRFDDVRGIYPDFEKSKGIIGFRHWNDHLYIHLDDSHSHTIYLCSTPPDRPYLKEASCWINHWKREKGGTHFSGTGYGKASFVLGGFKPNRVIKLILNGGKREIRSNERGMIRLMTFLRGEPCQISIND